MKKKIKKILSLAYVLVSIIFLLLALYFYYISRDFLYLKKSVLISNNPENIEKLKKTEGKMPFSFGFISDTENNNVSLWLVGELLKQNIQFLVFVGDAANDSLETEHKLFYQAVSKLNPKIPVFLVPANHDISLTNNNEFTKENFITLYGPANFSFVYNNCLFIFISNINQEDKECVDFLKSKLENRKPEIRYTFVFCPTPLRVILNKILEVPEWIGDMDRIIRKYKVDYVISGDYHRHLELTDDLGIQYIVSGSGGAHFHNNTLFGRFKNATKVTVYIDSVMKEIIIFNRLFFTDNSIKHFLYNEFMPKIQNCFWVVNLAAVIFIINVLFSIYNFIKRLEI